MENQFEPIKVVALRRGYYGNRIIDEGEKFSVADSRSEADLKESGGKRVKSADCLGSWMQRLDGGDNPSEKKMKVALSRDFDRGLRTAPAKRIEDIMPLDPRTEPLDANVAPAPETAPVAVGDSDLV